MRILTNPADTPVLDKNPADAYQQRLRNPIDDPSLVPQVTGPIYGHWLPLLVERHPTRVNSCPLRLCPGNAERRRGARCPATGSHSGPSGRRGRWTGHDGHAWEVRMATWMDQWEVYNYDHDQRTKHGAGWFLVPSSG